MSEVDRGIRSICGLVWMASKIKTASCVYVPEMLYPNHSPKDVKSNFEQVVGQTK
jgi:hypothetical protein